VVTGRPQLQISNPFLNCMHKTHNVIIQHSPSIYLHLMYVIYFRNEQVVILKDIPQCLSTSHEQDTLSKTLNQMYMYV